MTEKWVSQMPLKWTLGIVGVVAFLAAIALAIWIPAAQTNQFTKTLYTYGEQAQRTATPAEFATAVLQYNQALESAGMKAGDTSVYEMPHSDMVYFRVRLHSFAEQATAMNKGSASVESSAGLIQLKASLAQSRVSLYWFWFWRQGGMMLALYLPLGLAVTGVALLIVGIALKAEVRRNITAAPSSA
jgi:hypothetical protein